MNIFQDTWDDDDLPTQITLTQVTASTTTESHLPFTEQEFKRLMQDLSILLA